MPAQCKKHAASAPGGTKDPCQRAHVRTLAHKARQVHTKMDSVPRYVFFVLIAVSLCAIMKVHTVVKRYDTGYIYILGGLNLHAIEGLPMIVLRL